MQAVEFICIWFVEQHHVMLVDRRSVLSTVPLSAADSPGWRIVASNTSTAAEPTEPAGETRISVWPPLYPNDLPLLIGPEDALKQIEIFDLTCQNVQTRPDMPTQFDLDSLLTVSRADRWWVLPCHDPEDPLESVMFGEAACIGRHVFVADPVPDLIDQIIAQAAAGTPKTAPAVGYLIIPVAGKRVGPALLTQYRPCEPDVVVDVVLQPGSGGSLQPVIELKTSGGSPLNDAIESFRYCVLRRNAGNFNLPDFAYSHPVPSSETRLSSHVLFSLPEPTFHGDVIGIMSRGVSLTLAARLGAHVERSIETRGLWQVALLVRQEDGFIPATDDISLVSSGRLDDLWETIATATSDMAIDRLLWSQKARLARHLMRTAVATSYLIGDELGVRARAKLTDLLMGDRIVHLEHAAYAIASSLRLERLVAAQRPLDEPLRRLAHKIDRPALIACIVEIAEFGGQAGNDFNLNLLQSVLSDDLAVQAVVNVSTRAPAIAHWEAATAE